MTKAITLFALSLLISFGLRAQDILISQGGTVTTCEATIFDSGGADGGYQNGEDYTLTICSDEPDGCLQLSIDFFDIENGWDDLFVFEGPDTSGDLIAELTGVVPQQIISIDADCVTLQFTSDGSVTDTGFEIGVTCICPTCDDGILNGEEIGVDCGGPDCPECEFIIMDGTQSETTCSTTVYDNGFNGTYAAGSNDILTLCADSPDECMQAEFLSFEIEGEPWDTFTVFAGPDTDAPVYGTFGDLDPPQFINAGTECLTFQFISDGSVQQDGYEIEMSCACPTCDDGILNGQEVGVDCGGPDCPECTFDVISEGDTVTTCVAQLYDSGIEGPYLDNENYTFSYCGANPDACLQLDFTSIDIAFGDVLTIYDGLSTDGAVLAEYEGVTAADPFIAPGNCITLEFVSNGFTTAQGFDIAISCTDQCPTCDDGVLNGYEIGVDCGGPDCPECDFIIMDGTQTQTTCLTTVYDNGFDDIYSANSNDILTLCAETPDECMQAEFLSFEIEGEPWDTFTVFAGPDTDSPVFGTYGDLDPPQFINAGTECLTFQFISDGSVQQDGYEIEMSCACPTCDDGILNGQEVGVDCGGPDCPECTFDVISEQDTTSTCLAQLYDSGIDGPYLNNENYSFTYCGANPDACLQLDFTSIDIAFGDVLTIYDGFSTDGEVLAEYEGVTSAEPFIAPGSCITIGFVSNGFTTAEGFDIAISCTDQCPTCDDGILNGYEIGVDCGGPDCPECDFIIMDGTQTQTTCSTTVYDNGFDDIYSANSNDILTLCADTPDECMQAEFLSFEIEGEPFDTFTVFAGPDTDSPVFGTYGDFPPPQFINAGTECLTFQFISDGSVQQAGYEIEMSCNCPTCDDGILNGEEVGVDCGGPDCPECTFDVITEEVTETTCEAVLFDSGIEGPYLNNENYTFSYCSDSDECLQLDFTSIDIATGDVLTIYDGLGTDGAVLAEYDGVTSAAPFVAPGDCITLEFISNGFTTAQGFEIEVSCTAACPTCDDGILNGYEVGVDCGGPDCPECDFVLISDEVDLTTCDGLVFDSGGPDGEYSNVENYTMTICAADTAACISLAFAEFDIENGFDNLSVYAGEEVAGNPIQNFTGDLGAFIYSAPFNCITLNFTSDGSVTRSGFQFSIGCGDCPEPTEQDCLGANEVCEDVYIQEDYPPEPGNFPISLPDEACLDNSAAVNAIWYTFTIQEDGNLSFILTPEQNADDYDWGLFDLTNADCADIASNPSLLVSCNSFGQLGDNGPTGISTAEGGVGNVNGPGNLNGPPFNADYPVVAGQTFALLVQNWTGSFDGYTLDFSESTAQLFANLGPEVDEILLENCAEVTVIFDEAIDCESLAPEYFELNIEDQVYAVDSLSSDCPSEFGTTSVTLHISPTLPDTVSLLTLGFSNNDGELTNLCGANIDEDDTTSTVLTPQWLNIQTLVTPTFCDDKIGVVQFTGVNGGVPPFAYTFEGEPVDASLLVENLGVGTYQIMATDAIGCAITESVTVETEIDLIDIIMPNSFSPNGDMYNEEFGPMAIRQSDEENLGLIDVDSYLDIYELKIFNRWGKLVFESSRSKRFWDGEDTGGEAAAGTYFYVLRMRESCNPERTDERDYQGYLQLFK